MKEVSKTISIEIFTDGSFNVIQDDKYSDRLGYDEMLGLVSSLTLPERRPCIHWMKTKEQHEAYRNNYLMKTNEVTNNKL